MLHESNCLFGPFDSLSGFNGCSNFTLSDGVVTADFIGQAGSYVINFDLPAGKRGVGVQAGIRLQGWKNIQYLAVGYSKPLGFRHIKINNIRQGAWVDVGFTHQDIIWLLQNGPEKQATTEIKNIRLFIKGEPEETGASMSVRQFVLSERLHDNSMVPVKDDKQSLLSVLYGHLDHALRNYEANAIKYLQTGNYPMPGNQLLDWQHDEQQPQDLHKVNTYRSTWHAQHLAINLLQYARKTQQIGPVFAAKSLIEN